MECQDRNKRAIERLTYKSVNRLFRSWRPPFLFKTSKIIACNLAAFLPSYRLVLVGGGGERGGGQRWGLKTADISDYCSSVLIREISVVVIFSWNLIAGEGWVSRERNFYQWGG